MLKICLVFVAIKFFPEEDKPIFLQGASSLLLLQNLSFHVYAIFAFALIAASLIRWTRHPTNAESDIASWWANSTVLKYVAHGISLVRGSRFLLILFRHVCIYEHFLLANVVTFEIRKRYFRCHWFSLFLSHLYIITIVWARSWAKTVWALWSAWRIWHFEETLPVLVVRT